MTQSSSQPSAPSPFHRPSEAVVYRILEDLCEGAGGRCMLTLSKLARYCGLSVSTVNRAVASLAERGLIVYRPGRNQFHPSTYEISTDGRAKLRPDANAARKIGTPDAIDTQSDLSLKYLYMNDIGDLFHKNAEGAPGTPAERLARRIATELDDLKNLALYKSYCYRFPVGVVLNAFYRARETPANKIKKSRGALFNFLIQIYDRERKNNHDSGH